MKRRAGRDILTVAERSRLMARVRQKHTAPELIVRSALHRLGLRFTVNGPLNRSLLGRPDIVLPAHYTVVFVHGCFWHRHAGCSRATTPTTRRDFWMEKFRANLARDDRVQRALRKQGWRVLVVWECETKSPVILAQWIRRSLVATKFGAAKSRRYLVRKSTPRAAP